MMKLLRFLWPLLFLATFAAYLCYAAFAAPFPPAPAPPMMQTRDVDVEIAPLEYDGCEYLLFIVNGMPSVVHKVNCKAHKEKP